MNNQWIDVNSSSGNVTAIKYDPQTKTLSVRFAGKAPSEYEHYNVPQDLAQAFCDTAPNFNNSTGSFYAKNFAKGYGYKRVK